MKLFKSIKRKVGNAIIPVVGTILGLSILAGSVVGVALNSSKIVYRESNLSKQTDARQVLYIAAKYFSDEMNAGKTPSEISAELKAIFGDGLKITQIIESEQDKDKYYIWYPNSYTDGSDEYKLNEDGSDNVKEWLRATISKKQTQDNNGTSGKTSVNNTIFNKKAKIDELFSVGNLATVYLADEGNEFLPGRAYDFDEISLVESDIDTFDEAFTYMSKSGVIEIDSYGVALYQYSGKFGSNTSVKDPTDKNSTYYMIYKSGNTGGNYIWQYTGGTQTEETESWIYRQEYDMDMIYNMLSHYYHNYSIIRNIQYQVTYSYDELHDTHNMEFYYREFGSTEVKHAEIGWTSSVFAKRLSDYVFYEELCRLCVLLDNVREEVKNSMLAYVTQLENSLNNPDWWLDTTTDGSTYDDADFGEPGYCYRFTREGVEVDAFLGYEGYGTGYYRRKTFKMSELDDIISDLNYTRRDVESALVLTAESNTMMEKLAELQATSKYASYNFNMNFFVELMADARYKLALEHVTTDATLEDYAKQHVQEKYIDGGETCTVVYDGNNYNQAKIKAIANVTLSDPPVVNINGSGDNKTVSLGTYTFTVTKFQKKLEQAEYRDPTDAEMLQVLRDEYIGTKQNYSGNHNNKTVVNITRFQKSGNNYRLYGPYQGYNSDSRYFQIDQNIFNNLKNSHRVVVHDVGEYVDVDVDPNKTATVLGIDGNYTMPYDLYVEILTSQKILNHDDDAIREIVDDNTTLEYLRTYMSEFIKYRYMPRTTLKEIIGGSMDGTTNTTMTGLKEQSLATKLIEYYLEETKASNSSLKTYLENYSDYTFTFTQSQFVDIDNSDMIDYKVAFKIEFRNDNKQIIHTESDTVDFYIKLMTWNLYNSDGEMNSFVQSHEEATQVNGNGYIGKDKNDHNKEKTLFDPVVLKNNDGGTLKSTDITGNTKTLLGVIPYKERDASCYYKDEYVKVKQTGTYNEWASNLVSGGNITITQNTYYNGTFDLKEVTNNGKATLTIKSGQTFYVNGDFYMKASQKTSSNGYYGTTYNNDLLTLKIEKGGILFVSGNMYVDFYYSRKSNSSNSLSTDDKNALSGGVDIIADDAKIMVDGNFVYRGVKSTYASSYGGAPRDFRQKLTNATNCELKSEQYYDQNGQRQTRKYWKHDTSDIRCKLHGIFIVNGDIEFQPYNSYMAHTLNTNAFSNPIINATFYVDGVFDMRSLWTAGLYDQCRPNFIFAGSIKQPEIALGTIYNTTVNNDDWVKDRGYLFMIVEDAVDFSDYNFASVNIFSPYQQLIAAIENNQLHTNYFEQYIKGDVFRAKYPTDEMIDTWGLPSILRSGFKKLYTPGDIGAITVHEHVLGDEV